MVEQADHIIDYAENGAVLTDAPPAPSTTTAILHKQHQHTNDDELREYPPPQGIQSLNGLLAAHHHLQNNSKTPPSTINGGEPNLEAPDHQKSAESKINHHADNTMEQPALDVEVEDGVDTPNSSSTITTAFSVEELKELAEQMEAAADMDRRMSMDTIVPIIDHHHDNDGDRKVTVTRKRKSSTDTTTETTIDQPAVKRKPGRPRKNSLSEQQRQFEHSVVSPSAKWPAVVVGDPIKELQRACQYGQTVSVEAMLRKGTVSVSGTDNNQNTALHEASVYGKPEAVKVLIKFGTPLEPVNVLNETPLQLSRSPQVTLLLKEFIARMAAARPKLHNAIIADDLEQVKALLGEETGSSINDTDEMGFHCLHWCAIKNRPDMIRLLRDAFPGKLKLDVKSQCQQQLTPLHEASRFNSPEALQCLLDCGADPLIADGNEYLPVDHAPNKIIRRIFRRFGRKHDLPDLLRSPRLPADMVADGDDPDSMFTLDPEDGPSSSVGFTREERKLQQVLSILGRSDSTGTAQNKSSLASRLSSADAVAPKKRGRPPKPKPDSVKPSSVGPDIGFRDKSTGRTLLHRYAGKGVTAMVKELLSSDHNLLLVVDNAGYSALHEAALKGRKEAVKELLKHAKKQQHLQTLLDMQSTTTGDTALHDAVENGHHVVVRLLLDAGASVGVKNKAGLKAAQVCADDDDEMRLFFASAGDGAAGISAGDGAAGISAGISDGTTSTTNTAGITSTTGESVVKRRPGRPRKVSSSGASTGASIGTTVATEGTAQPKQQPKPQPVKTELSPLLLVNLDAGLPQASPPTTLWHFLSCQLEDRSPTFTQRHREQYGREIGADDRDRLLASPAIGAIPSLVGALRDDHRSIYLVDKDAVYKAARHAHGRLKVLDDATIQYVDVGKPVTISVQSVPLKMKMKQQWRK